MGSAILVQGILLTMVVVFLALRMTRQDKTYPRRWAKVRVRTDDRRYMAEPKDEEEFQTTHITDWLIFGTLTILILLVFLKMI